MEATEEKQVWRVVRSGVPAMFGPEMNVTVFHRGGAFVVEVPVGRDIVAKTPLAAVCGYIASRFIEATEIIPPGQQSRAEMLAAMDRTATSACFVPAVYDWQFIGAFEGLYPDEVLPTVLVCDGQEWAALDAELRAVERDVNTLEGSVYVREGAPGKPSTWRLRPA